MSITRQIFSQGSSWPDATWTEEAACKGVELEVFFSIDEEEQKGALELCKTCPVQQDCLRFAIENREMYGIWGGMRETERRGIIREQRRLERERRRRQSDAA